MLVKQSKMPPERRSLTRKFELGKLTMYATVGLREDGTPGELFLRTNDMGTTARGLTHALALMVSCFLQNGGSMEKVVEKLRYLEFEPRGMTRDADIPSASSIMDYLAQWLEKKFIVGEEKS